VEIRGYEARDRESCRALWTELTQWHRDLYEDQSIGGDDPGNAFDEHLERVGAERIWVAEEHEAVLGFVGLIVEGRRGELEPLVVAAGARGRGIGRALAEHVIAAAPAGTRGDDERLELEIGRASCRERV